MHTVKSTPFCVFIDAACPWILVALLISYFHIFTEAVIVVTLTTPRLICILYCDVILLNEASGYVIYL